MKLETTCMYASDDSVPGAMKASLEIEDAD